MKVRDFFMTDRRVPKRLSRVNWLQFANLDSKHTQRGYLLADVFGTNIMYATTNTHVFVYVENHYQHYLIEYAELSNILNLNEWLAHTTSRSFEHLADRLHQAARFAVPKE